MHQNTETFILSKLLHLSLPNFYTVADTTKYSSWGWGPNIPKIQDGGYL